MFTTFAMEEVRESSWANEPLYEDKPRHSARHRSCEWKDRFFKRYGLLLVGACLFTLYTLILSWSVHALTVRDVRKEMAIEYSAQLEAYKKQEAERIQAEYFMSGDASREAAINQDAMELAKDSGVWKNENAFKCYCWNVVVRKMSPLYPSSIQSCLSQDGQYDFYDTKGVYTEEKFEWAKSVLEQAESGKLPSFLTVGHLYLEMKDGGADCVLHTSFEKNGADDPWRYRG